MGQYIELEKLKQVKLIRPVVLTGGYFDLFHLGHAGFLKTCKDFGKTLIVCALPDKMAKHRKGNMRPIIDAETRAKLISHLECVDFSISGDYRTEDKKVYDIIKPDILVLTIENKDRKLKYLKSSLGPERMAKLDVQLIPHFPYASSTTQTIDLIISRYKALTGN